MFEKEKIIIAYTLEKCDDCGNQLKRKFSESDVLFAKKGNCSSCEGTMTVEKIFGESIEP